MLVPIRQPFQKNFVEKCISSGSPENGVVFDPFMGTGTSWIVANKLNRRFVGTELNKDFFDFAKERFENSLPQNNPTEEKRLNASTHRTTTIRIKHTD